MDVVARANTREAAVVEGAARVEGAPRPATRPVETRGARVTRNIAVVTAGQFLSWTAGSMLIVITPRFLGDTNVGKYTFAFSVTSIATAVILFGSITWLAREIARRPQDARHLAWNGMISRIPAILIGVVAVVLFVEIAGYPQTTKAVVYVACITMALNAVGSVITAALQGLERMAMMSAVTVVERISLLAAVAFLLVYLDKGVIAYAAATVAAVGMSTLVRTVFFARVVGLRSSVDLGLCRALYRNGVPFLVWNLALIIYGGIDIIMLSLMDDEAVVGWYGLAYRFIAIPAFIPAAVTTALLPALSAASGDEFNRLARKCADLLLVLTIPVMLFFVVGAGAIIDFMNYGSGFDNSVILMRILGLIAVPVAIGMLAGTALMATNKEGPWARVAIAAAVLNPLLNLIAIPYFAANFDNGAIGAAIITVITEVGVVSAALVLAPRGMFHSSNVRTGLRSMLAGVPMVGAMALALPFGLIPLMAAGGITYAVGAVAFGAVSISEIRTLPGTIFARRTAEVPA
jgi:O-antigen/teichoic acid export membrane protein